MSNLFSRLGATMSEGWNESERVDGSLLSNDDDHDENPYGVHVISDSEKAIVDIVAIHGLGGHWKKSWTHPRTNVFWLQDLLPKEILNARIMSYGYNATYSGNKDRPDSIQSTRDHGEMLVQRLVAKRRLTKTPVRPIIFIAHSFGGIVLKSALLIASKANDNHLPYQKSFIDSTKAGGILFFGTPQFGASGADLMAICLNILSTLDSYKTSRYHEDLREGSRWIQEQCEDFAPISHWFVTKCFYETQETYFLSGRKLVVPKMSACLPGTVNVEKIALNTDHRGLVKFASASDEGFEAASCQIVFIIESILSAAVPDVNQIKEELLRSLAYPDMNYRRIQADKACLNTCKWILQHPMLQNWRKKDRSLLWVKGKPGSGKSTLMAYLRKEYLNTLPPQTNIIVLDFFFHGRGTNLQKTSIGMLRYLLYQLYVQASEILPHVQVEHKRKVLEGGNMWNWKIEELQRQFADAFVYVSKVHRLVLFIDALDEAGDEGIEIIKYLQGLNDLIGPTNTAQICISCRYYPITAIIPGFEIQVENENTSDIRTFVRYMLRSIFEALRSDRDERSEYDELSNDIVNLSRNVFQWAALVTPEIEKRYYKGQSCKQIRKTLQNIPNELQALYKTILENSIEPEDRPKTLHLMQWICLVSTPLTVHELRYALACDGNQVRSAGWTLIDEEDFVTDNVKMAKQITSLSGGLLELGDSKFSRLEDQTVHFVHQSVKDYMLSEGFKAMFMSCRTAADFERVQVWSSSEAIRQGHVRLFQACVNFLKLDIVIFQFNKDKSHQEVQVIRSLGDLSFLRYAVLNLPFHGAKFDTHEYLGIDLARTFDCGQSKTTEIFYMLWNMYKANEFRDESTLLHLITIFNLPGCCKQLLDGGFDINKRDSHGWTSLHYAVNARNQRMINLLASYQPEVSATTKKGESPLYIASGQGQLEAVKVLLEHDADINAQGGTYGNALQAAVSQGQCEIVRTLLDSGARVNEVNGFYGTALQAAAFNGSVNLIQLLLIHGADVKLQGGSFGDALQAAASQGHCQIMSILLNSGADINEVSGRYGTALQVAAFKGSLDSIHLLLTHGADVNIQGGYYGNALQAAAIRGHYEIVRALLEVGARINEVSGLLGTALQAASCKGFVALVRLLLSNGANVNIQGGEYSNALQAATFEGHREIVKTLLHHGANVNGTGKSYGTILQAASFKGFTEIVELLIDAGADPNIEGGFYGSALQAAGSQGHRDIVEILLSAGADVNVKGGKYGNALAAAVSKKNTAIVRLLINAGADLNAKGGKFGSALLDAALNSDQETLRLLMDAGANINAISDPYGTALSAVSLVGNDGIVQLLLSAGADANVQGGYYGNALQAASYSGGLGTVQLLLRSGADYAAQGGRYETALQAAIVADNRDVINILQEHSAFRLSCSLPPIDSAASQRKPTKFHQGS